MDDHFERVALADAVVNASKGLLQSPAVPAPTGLEMCELISQFFMAVANVYVTPMEIWNYSPTGELYMVFVRYNAARAWQAHHRALPPPRSPDSAAVQIDAA